MSTLGSAKQQRYLAKKKGLELEEIKIKYQIANNRNGRLKRLWVRKSWDGKPEEEKSRLVTAIEQELQEQKNKKLWAAREKFAT